MKSAKMMIAAALMVAAWGTFGEIVVERGRADGASGGRQEDKTLERAADRRTSGHIMEFVNKDRLHGSFVSASSNGVVWMPLAASASVEFDLSAVSRIVLEGRRKDCSGENALVSLTNGDSLPGSIASLDENEVVLETPYAGKLVIRRAMVDAIRPQGTSSLILYAGPKSLDEWSVSKTGRTRTWVYRDGALYATQPYPVARAIDSFPDKARIEFTAEWRSGYPSFWVAFCGDAVPDPANCYMLQVSGSSIYLQRMSRESGSRNIGGGENLEQFSNRRSEKAKFVIYVNKERRSIALFVDGKMVREWIDPSGFAGKGSVLTFRPNNQGDLKISGIVVSSWDGTLPTAVEGGGLSGEDAIRFENGDKVSGKLLSISAGKVRFEASYGSFDVPVERVTEVSLAKARAERARRNKDDIRCALNGGGQITFKVIAVEQGLAKGCSENFGEATVDLGYVAGIDFNIYRHAEEESDEDNSVWPTDY